MRQDLTRNHLVLDAGDDLHRPAAGRASLDVNAKYPFQSLQLYALRVQVIADRRATGVSSSSSSDTLRLAPLPDPPSSPRPGVGCSVQTPRGGAGKFGFYSVVPVPATVWLFGSGLLGLAGMARKKKFV